MSLISAFGEEIGCRSTDCACEKRNERSKRVRDVVEVFPKTRRLENVFEKDGDEENHYRSGNDHACAIVANVA